MTTEKIHIAHLFLEYAKFLGVKSISNLSGLWESKIDDQWTIKCNGHKETIDGVPGFSWLIEYNGWPAGILDIMGDGIICAGEGGNEENLRKAIELKMTA